jgi:hypothetical protein
VQFGDHGKMVKMNEVVEGLKLRINSATHHTAIVVWPKIMCDDITKLQRNGILPGKKEKKFKDSLEFWEIERKKSLQRIL